MINVFNMIGWFRTLIAELKRESGIPSPPFKASKRRATIMYGLWHGRLSPDQARQKARSWGFSEASIDQMIDDATKAPSYWSRHAVREP